ncbi:MAG TPA: PEP/pyruvate-binding domain-containing protein [Thermodesulfovibrionales bacterium]|nr:PEP/pyruvate-binding domain-containing protein [Thermodesulfovibrionales bacterium]
MKLWQHISGLLKTEETHGKRKDEGGEALIQKFCAFQRLLSSNNAALELMADMGEKLSGDFLFDRHYVDSTVSTVSERVKDLVENLRIISKGKYQTLDERFDEIQSGIQTILTQKKEIAESPYTLSFGEITREKAEMVGSKVANICEIRNRLALPVPDGFGITAFAFKRFMEQNDFFGRIKEKLDDLSIDDLEALNARSREIQDLIAGGEIPSDLQAAIAASYLSLCEREGSKVKVSVRSSALQEDGEFSFAGQYSTFLNVPFESLFEKYKCVVASLFNPRALFYVKTKGFQESDMVMSVGVLTMVDAGAAGVVYSADPNDPEMDVIIISAVKGLGKGLVDGTITPEVYLVSRSGGEIIKKSLSKQSQMLACNADGGLEEIALDERHDGKAAVTDEEIKRLARYALSLETHFQGYQDIEWAIDRHKGLCILQSRPLRLLARKASIAVPTRVKGYTVLIDKGAIAFKGIGFGKAYILRQDEGLEDFPQGAVLVAKHTSPKFVAVMNRASAIVTDVGSPTGHMASLAREFQVAALLDTEVATSLIQQGEEITVDAINCNIYKGHVTELEEFAVKRENLFKETRIFKTLEDVLKLISPLYLVNPDDKAFKAESCRTYHDITRFCHEMAIHELFDVTGISADEVGAIRLVAGIPVDIYLIDLGGGTSGEIREDTKDLLLKNISSIPFNAFLRGLTAMKWPEPRPADAKGFLGMLATSASIPEEELKRTAEKSFSIISGDYMNFAIRLGYHLSTVEAYAGENINDNYIKFTFKGGGAIIDRRLRRIRLITEILRKLDFSIKVVEDVVNASLMKYRRSSTEKALEILGRLTVYTKQLDMVMYNDAITDVYIEEFCSAYVTGH